MKNYRGKIRTMPETAMRQIKELCDELGLEPNITEILSVGQPTKINPRLFLEKYDLYLAGKISPDDKDELFGLSRSGFYKKLKVLKLPTATEVKLAKQVKTKQTSQPSVPESITLEDLQNTESFLDLIEQTQETHFGLSKEEDDDFQLEADN